MKLVTTWGRWLGLLLILACFTGTAQAQRVVTLTLNTASVPDTIRTDSFVEVRGAANGTAPATLLDGNIIDWSDASTLEPVNIGGDYWQVQFEIDEATDLTFKFYSQQLQESVGEGWEADPNPSIPPGEGDTTLAVHFFESQREWRGATQDRGPYDWRPWEPKEDSVAVWFRVAMFGEEADADGYTPSAEAPAQRLGVRGDNLDINGDGTVTGPIDWGTTNVVLQRESSVTGSPGYNIYSGVAYYPNDLIGQTQAYKFVLDNEDLTDGNLGWEEGNVEGNRTFTLPASDTTLQWVYYGDTPPAANEPVQSAVVFTVDLQPLQDIGLFDPARGDSLWVFGDFNDWNGCWPDRERCFLPPLPGDPQFENAFTLTFPPGSERNFKFFLDLDADAFRDAFGIDIVPSGWEEPITTQGGNRTFIFEGIQDGFQELPVFFFNDIFPGNVIPEQESIDVTWKVDMSAALEADDPFNPATDSVTVQFADPFWSITQGFPLDEREDDFQDRTGIGDQVDFAAFIKTFQLEDPDGDLVYEGTLTVNGPTYNGIQYRYGYNYATDTGRGIFVEPEGGTAGEGRRRTRFIRKNADGSWPETWEFPQETFMPEGGPFDFEPNPETSTGIETVDTEVPTSIRLEQNYPNPFNPTTTFEYAVTQQQHVRLVVYDVLGRAVATLVDGLQAPATYQVTFDGSALASGVYLYRLETETATLTRRMLLIK